MNELLTLEDIAQLYRTTYRRARDYIVKRRDFPKPIQGCTKRYRLWLRESIENYIRQGQT